MRRRRIILTVICLTVTLVLAWVGLMVLDLRAGERRAPELPRSVAREGLTVSRLYGRDTPLPVPLYPGARVYGSDLTQRPISGGPAVFILQGTYENPDEIGEFYRENLKEYDVGKNESEAGTYVSRIDARNRDGRVFVQVLTDPKGLTRDFWMWLPRDYPVDVAGGDPKETMITMVVKWWRK